VKVLLLALASVACARETAPPVHVVERIVYVAAPPPSKQAEDRELIAALRAPMEGIDESPLVVEAERRRNERRADLAAGASAEREVVYEPVYVPTPAHVVIVRDLPPAARRHDRWWYDRAAERCERRRTRWARERCFREIAR
jgi:hypothetical protein